MMLMITLFLSIIVLSACQESKTYDDLKSEFQLHLDSQNEIYENRISFLNEIYDNTLKSVVSITVSIGASNQIIRGTGVIFHESSTHYYVLTNHHVVHNDDGFLAMYRVNDFLGNMFIAHLHFSSAAYDLAIISFSKPSYALSVIDMREQNSRVDEEITILGYPNTRMINVNMGNILAYTKISIDQINSNIIDIQFDILATYTPVKFGSSGSAVIDQNHELVGIVYSAYFLTGFEISNATFIIPIEQVKVFIDLYNGSDSQ
ncbi:MAG: serine protease [Acholeplasmataceae bacterium]|nr:serine protease [Acholeplasmataceae bacterium]